MSGPWPPAPAAPCALCGWTLGAVCVRARLPHPLRRDHCLQALLRMEGFGLHSAVLGLCCAPSLPWGPRLHPPHLDTLLSSHCSLFLEGRHGALAGRGERRAGWVLKVASWHPCGPLLQPPGAGNGNRQGLPVVCANGVLRLLSSAPSHPSLQPWDRTRPS